MKIWVNKDLNPYIRLWALETEFPTILFEIVTVGSLSDVTGYWIVQRGQK